MKSLLLLAAIFVVFSANAAFAAKETEKPTSPSDGGDGTGPRRTPSF